MNVLQEAEQIVGGQRAVDYGDMKKSFTDIAKMWSVIAGVELTAHQVGLMMMALKLVRESNSPKRDNLVDIAGYALCTERILETPDPKPEPSKKVPDEKRKAIQEALKTIPKNSFG